MSSTAEIWEMLLHGWQEWMTLQQLRELQLCERFTVPTTGGQSHRCLLPSKVNATVLCCHSARRFKQHYVADHRDHLERLQLLLLEMFNASKRKPVVMAKIRQLSRIPAHMSTAADTPTTAVDRLVDALQHCGWTDVHEIARGSFGIVFRGEDPMQRDCSIKWLPSSPSTLVEHESDVLRLVSGQTHLMQLYGVEAIAGLGWVIIAEWFAFDKFQDLLENRETAGAGPDLAASYTRCLLTALKQLHSKGIIHRDVKPSNFLYAAATKRGKLVDFGLAEHCRTGNAALATQHDHSRDAMVDAIHRSARRRRNAPCELPTLKTSRIGTPGFRPPEVLLGAADEYMTGAIDVWAAGLILASILCRRRRLWNCVDNFQNLTEVSFCKLQR